MEIRLVQEKDYQRVLDILNEAIAARKFTAQLSLATMEMRKEWFIHHSAPRHPMFVAVVADQVVGWITLTEFRAGREGFRFTSEISYYIDSRFHRQGIGSLLMKRAIEAAKEIGFKNLVAVVFDTNICSRKLVKKHGFKLWGHMPDTVDIDGQSIGFDYWGLKIEK
ncbi:GNAT family N-acetyltransferase [Acetobacterium woodii]|uniref:Phosphinothricin acetyltransferase n=1 Tax=Acetobacterium woodii (strain ATCC 29683 / DSM 1030 / JCM 2381 / KCTC 1655 / WB1) TaxID=931626 RepID=H6LD27_ACEWD|nr:GNAT family N-acetyltransferase [Acetobacterium woodii]AFA47866.1 phosphinothricin acetyltransferase [Acetobacterium woodii DSM 1030]